MGKDWLGTRKMPAINPIPESGNGAKKEMVENAKKAE